MKKKILIIQHHRKFGGASKSISEFILKLQNEFEFDVICPSGTTSDFFKNKKINIYKFVGIPSYDITEIGSYTGLRKILFIREIFYFFIFLLTIFKIKKKYDIIHLNDTNLIIIAPLLKFLFKANIICHVRTRVNINKLSALIYFISKKYIDKFICIDKSTFSTSPDKKKSIIIYNIFDDKKNKKKYSKRNKKKFKIGFLGSLDFHKGLDFYFDCISEINKTTNNFTFIIGGSLSVPNKFLLNILEIFGIKKNFNRIYYNFKNKNYKNVKFLNSVNNLNKFYKQIDLICFPSRMNALGRPIIEAASYGIPSLVCLDKYFNDTIIDKKTGYVLKFGKKKSFIKKLYSLSKNKKKLYQLGINAKKNYYLRHNLIKNSNKLSNVYSSII
tara:strand:+ start:9321 stop:10478 length:1158 start_codon:yes stop_codon:yes gene_type:complete